MIVSVSSPRNYLTTVFLLSLLCACTPRVEVALPEKPIEININAKIEHDVRIRVEKDVSQLVKTNNDLF